MRSLPFFLFFAACSNGGAPVDAGPEASTDGAAPCFPPPRGFDTSIKNGALTVSPMPLDARAIALDHEGRVLIAGAQGPDSFVARIGTNGMVDTSFGSKGIFIQSFGAANDAIQGLAVDGQDRILMAGGLDQGGSNYPFVARLGTDGTIDALFTTFIGNVSLGSAWAVAPDQGGAYVMGETHFVMRLLDDGTTDAAFKLVQGGAPAIAGLAVSDGVITLDRDGNLWKYGKDGTQDPNFGGQIFGTKAAGITLAKNGTGFVVGGENAPSTIVLADANGKPAAMSGSIGMNAFSIGTACNRFVLGGGSNGNAQVGLLGLDAKPVAGDKTVDSYPVTADASTGTLLSAVQSDGRIVFVESVSGTGVVEFARVSP